MSDGIAIVGLAGRFPGARNTKQFWANLTQGVESVRHFSDEELLAAGLDPSILRNPDYVKARSVLDDVDMFDAEFFGINAREAEVMDPQHRLFLEVAWEALEDAGCDSSRYSGAIGVYAGLSLNTYLLNNVCSSREYIEDLVRNHQLGAFPVLLGNDKDFLPSRTAYKLDLRGPAISVQTACSTSLVAVHQACRSLMGFECDMALAGGVSISLPQIRGYMYQEGGMGSPDGHTRPFDASAQGCSFGGGVGVVVLKRLDEALADGDQIYAVIRGSAVNNDGAGKVSYTAPSIAGQADVIRTAQAVAGITADTISYVEAHGTGTPLGDPIEIAALTQAFRSTTDRRGYCAIGSVKSNLGHLEAASGVTGLIKTALALKYGKIPPSLNFKTPNPHIDFEGSPFFVNAALSDWPQGVSPRRAGVSSLGVGGTNVHVVLEEAPERVSAPSGRSAHVLVISGRTPQAVDAATLTLAEHFENDPAASLADVAVTLQAGRKRFEHRRAVACSNREDAITALRSAASKPIRKVNESGVAAFMFPGQGAQAANMMRGLYDTESVFRDEIDRCFDLLKPRLRSDLRSNLFPGPDELENASTRIHDTELAQLALFVVEYSLAKLWLSWGIHPSVLIGHSIGEFAAACLAGVFSLESAIAIVVERGRLMQSLPRGAMLAVRTSEEKLSQSLRGNVSIAAINSRLTCVASGPIAEIELLEKELATAGIVSRRLNTSHAFHSSMMDPVLEAFRKVVAGFERRAPNIPIVSTLTGRLLTSEEAMDPGYWASQLRSTVRFADALAAVSAISGAAVLLEVGPGDQLTRFARQRAGAGDAGVISSLGDSLDGTRDSQAVMEALGELWAFGVEPDLSVLYSGELRSRVSLPPYPFERKRYWVEPPVAGRPGIGASDPQEVVEMPDRISPATAGKRKTREARIADTLKTLFSELSGVKASEIQDSVEFLDLGFDSLFLTQATQEVQKKFGIRISFRQMLGDLSSVAALSEYLDHQMPANVFADSQPESVPSALPVMPMTTAVDDSSANAFERLVQQQLQAMQQLVTQQLAMFGASQAVPPTAAAHVAPVSEISRSSESAEPRPFSPYKPLQRGAQGGLTEVQGRFLAEFVRRYTSRTQGSKNLVQRDRAVLADPRVASGFRAQWKEIVYPIVTNRAKGSRIWDVDGNEYIDIVNGFGAIMFGHSPDYVTDAIRSQLDRGMEIGPQTELAGLCARLICDFTGMERASFCNSGSEAVMAAVRLSRTVTGRQKIVLFAGSYHGSIDEVLVKSGKSKETGEAAPAAPGIPKEKVQNVLVLDYGTPEALEIIRRNANDLAAVLVEPVQSRRPELQPAEFLREIRRITEASGTALIFDEVVTGFRIHPGGMQAVFGIRADLATYGKVIAGGMPMGIVTGSARFMDALDGGMWQYGDESFPEVGVTFFAGTFFRHPLALAAVYSILKYLKTVGPSLQQELNDKSTRLAKDLNDFLVQEQVPLRINHCGSVFYFHFPADLRFGSLFYYFMREKGIHIQEGFPFFLTTTHSDDDIARVAKAFKESILDMRTAEMLPFTESAPALIRQSEPSTVRMTEAQREIFLGSQMGVEAACSYNDSLSIHFRGALDRTALDTALQQLVTRHSIFRTSVEADGETLRIAPERTHETRTVDLGYVLQENRDAAYAVVVEEENRTPFNLSTGPLLRTTLVRFGDDYHALLLMGHHIACDGWSFAILLQNLSEIYSATKEGRAWTLPEPVSFSEYALWEKEHEKSPDYAAAEEYWIGEFKIPSPALDLPTDRLRPPVKTYAGAMERAVIDAELYKNLKRVGSRNGCTQFATVLAVFTAMLSRLSNQNDIVVAVPAAGQSAIGKDELVGHCANLLPVRTRVGIDSPFVDHLTQTKDIVLNAYDNQSYTYGALIRKITLERDPSRSPLVSAMFNIDRSGFKGLKFSGLKTDILTNPKTSVIFDIYFNIIETDSGLELNCEYNTDLFDASTIQRWLLEFRTLIESVVSDSSRSIGKLELIPDSETRLLLDEWNRTDRPDFFAGTIHERISSRSRRCPDSIAISLGNSSVSYAVLEERSSRLANYLSKLGVGQDSLVAVAMDRSIDMVIALLGILKAGAAYVPLDPSYPIERIQFVLDDSRAPVLITEERLVRELGEGLAKSKIVCLRKEWPAVDLEPIEAPKVVVHPDSRAYVIYTSGSTGKPKGVEVTHGGVVNFLDSMAEAPGITSEDRLLAVTTLSFDIAGLELFLPLISGGRVVIATEEETRDGNRLLAKLKAEAITIMQATPATWQLLLDAGIPDGGELKILCGGEALPPDLAARLLLKGSSLWNMYGPTETTIWSGVFQVEDSDQILIGRPIANTTFYILDSLGQPVPVGVSGELLIGGAGVARGYFNRPDLTADKFVPDTFAKKPKSRLYRTGDLVRYRADGNLEYLGRLDNQVKIRGFRIELGEIEATLRQHPEVHDAAVVVREDNGGEKRLVAYVVDSNGKKDSSSETNQVLKATLRGSLRAHMELRLPLYMVPAAILFLDRIPRTPNLKVDRSALPAPEGDSVDTNRNFVAPSTREQELLATIWHEVLSIKKIGVQDEILELGADSLQIFRISMMASERGLSITPAMIFKYRTIESITNAIEGQIITKAVVEAGHIKPIARDRYRLTPRSNS